MIVRLSLGLRAHGGLRSGVSHGNITFAPGQLFVTAAAGIQVGLLRDHSDGLVAKGNETEPSYESRYESTSLEVNRSKSADTRTSVGLECADMASNLSQIPDASLAELAEVSDGMQEFIRSTDMQTQQTAMEALQKRGIVQRLFPGEIQREHQRIVVADMRQMAQAKGELLALYTKTQIEIARRRADALISSQGMHLQTELTKFAQDKILEVTNTLNGSRSRFLPEMKTQLQGLEEYRDLPQLYRPAIESIQHQISTYFDSVKILLDGFIGSLTSKVGEINR